MSRQRPLSLTARLTLAVSVALVAFLGLTGLVLDRAFAESARDAVKDRLQGVVYTLLVAADLDAEDGLLLPDATPEPRLSRPSSGLYARVSGERFRWNSSSQVGHELQWPPRVNTGDTVFYPPDPAAAEPLFTLSLGVAWESPDGRDVPFTFSAAESSVAFEAQLAEFRRSLWGWLGAASVLLLLVQSVVLGWSLKPLRSVGAELARVQRGETEAIEREYPQELAGLTGSINTFISAERKQLARFRNSLADLAHSLKTPLAVMRSSLESEQTSDGELLRSQVKRMNDIVSYQLKRARTSGHQTFARPIPIGGSAEDIVQTLERAHRGRQIQCEFAIDPTARFYGEAGDLAELLGNLLENAFKWCRQSVLLSATAIPGETRSGLLLSIEDDGPGIAPEEAERLLQRGVRGDEQIAGHGIGLAVVRELTEAYGAQLGIERSALGGARIWIRFQGD